MNPTPSPTPRSILNRAAILAVAGVVLLALLHRWSFLTSPSERFHAMIPLLWLLNIGIRWKSEGRLRWSYNERVIFMTALALLLVLLWNIATQQAQLTGGRTDWIELFCKLVLTASCFVLYGVLVSSVTALLELSPRVKTLLTSPRGGWLRLLRVAVTFGLFIPYIFTVFNIHRSKIGDATDPQKALHLPFQIISFPAAEDGVMLSGWYIPARNSEETVVLSHGIGANKGSLLGVVRFLHKAGFNVLGFDFRGHGESAGHTTSFGYYEARDVKGAVRYLSQKHPSSRIATFAFSMGGAALLHAIGDLPQVRGVIVDSTFANFRKIVASQTMFLPPFMNGPAVAATDFFGRLELGVPLDEMSPEKHIASVSPRPLLIIHGTADLLIPPSQAETNFAAARQPKELWLVEGAGHCGNYAVAHEEYEHRVDGFLKKCLGH